MAFDFDTEKNAERFNLSIKLAGRVFESPRGDSGWEKVVYLGRVKV